MFTTTKTGRFLASFLFLATTMGRSSTFLLFLIILISFIFVHATAFEATKNETSLPQKIDHEELLELRNLRGGGGRGGRGRSRGSSLGSSVAAAYIAAHLSYSANEADNAGKMKFLNFMMLISTSCLLIWS